MTDIDFVLGFIAGEGTFTLSMNSADGKYYPRMRFQVRIHERDQEAAVQAREVFEGVGEIADTPGRDTVEWVVRSKDDLEFLRDKIEAYAPDIWWETEKAENFNVWSDILDIHLDGRTTADQAIEMCELARDGLNINNGVTRQRWNEYIESLKKRA
jgi:hypothetical protein